MLTFYAIKVLVIPNSYEKLKMHTKCKVRVLFKCVYTDYMHDLMLND